MTNDDLVQFGNEITALLERYRISDGKFWTQRLADDTLRFRVEGTLPLVSEVITTTTNDDDRSRRRCSGCGQVGDSVCWPSRYGRGLICQRCSDEETSKAANVVRR